MTLFVGSHDGRQITLIPSHCSCVCGHVASTCVYLQSMEALRGTLVSCEDQKMLYITPGCQPAMVIMMQEIQTQALQRRPSTYGTLQSCTLRREYSHRLRPPRTRRRLRKLLVAGLHWKIIRRESGLSLDQL